MNRKSIITAVIILVVILGLSVLMSQISERRARELSEKEFLNAMESLTAPSFTSYDDLSEEQKEALRLLTAPEEPATPTSEDDFRAAMEGLDAR
ncbi:MAG: hypothetical protein Q8L64_06690 [bacterium]|nr:hypothetical protein [bacterium]